LVAGRLEALQAVGIQSRLLQGEHHVPARAIDAAERLVLGQTVPGIEGDVLTELPLLGGRKVLGPDADRRQLLPWGVFLVPADQSVFDRLALVRPPVDAEV